jgi:hypothetical protein
MSEERETTSDKVDERGISEAESSGEACDQEEWEDALESPNAALDL